MKTLGRSLKSALLQQSRQAQRTVLAAPSQNQFIRTLSVLPSQAGAEKQHQQAWTQHLLRLGLGLGAGAGLFAAYGGFSSSQCEQQASAGQTKVSSWFSTLMGVFDFQQSQVLSVTAYMLRADS
jgi:hypothetical protein